MPTFSGDEQRVETVKASSFFDHNTCKTPNNWPWWLGFLLTKDLEVNRLVPIGVHLTSVAFGDFFTHAVSAVITEVSFSCSWGHLAGLFLTTFPCTNRKLEALISHEPQRLLGNLKMAPLGGRLSTCETSVTPYGSYSPLCLDKFSRHGSFGPPL